MYAALWRRLPGNRLAKAAQSLLLFALVVALLFLVIFPWANQYLPFDDVTVTPG